MNWQNLTEEAQLESIRLQSHNLPVVIFKHSTRCSISSMAKNRLERETFPETIAFYYLDLLKYRSLSNKIAEEFQIWHESPQVLMIRNGACVYDESHGGITMEDLMENGA
jgi:bacillithiol system protein YtxJ